MVVIERRTRLAGPPERAFDLSLDVNAHMQAMGSSGERAIDGVTTGLIGLSQTVTWRARHFGLRWTMTSEIVEWDRPRHFVDEQVRGPFRSFRHLHQFHPADDGTPAMATDMVDRVTFVAPFGVLGRVAETMVLRRYLARLIDTRNEFLAREIARPTP